MPHRFAEIYRKAVAVLENGLPKHLTYHCVEHTEYVLKMVEYIAEKEQVSTEDTFLIKVAALYHDIGYIHDSDGHEKRGCVIATEALLGFQFCPTEISKVCGMIMATKIPQQPQNLLEQILADADLEYLATHNFKRFGDRLFNELRYFNKSLTRQDWNAIQLEFMQKHQYHTDYCQRYKEWRKMKNREGLIIYKNEPA